MNLYDAHIHFQDDRLVPHHERIIGELAALGLKRMVVNGTREDDWPRVLQLARDHAFILPSFGCHPWYLDQRTPDWETSLIAHLDAVPSAIGEIGLDRWMENADTELQERMFVTQLRMAAERNLPVSIHCLKAWGQLLELLQVNPRPQRGFLLHSYGGSAEMIPRFAKLGAYFSISGHFAHERKARQLAHFKLVPTDRLLIETDAPDMWPPASINRFPWPGVNHPANLHAIYEFVARSLGRPVAALALEVEGNFQRIFAEL